MPVPKKPETEPTPEMDSKVKANSLKARELFSVEKDQKLKLSSKLKSNWSGCMEVPPHIAQAYGTSASKKAKLEEPAADLVDSAVQKAIQDVSKYRPVFSRHRSSRSQRDALVLHSGKTPSEASSFGDSSGSLIRIKEGRKIAKPEWHAPWKLKTVISGHTGWVRCLAVDVSNEWFASGAGDRIIKIWDLASGQLKLSLTGHISTVRGLAVSDRHPYLFSAGEDKQIKCWDLEYNKVIRHYHGHLSGIYSLALHPTQDVLVTGGRDATCRQIHALTGHLSTVTAIQCQATDPQIITGSEDSTIKLWDLVAGKAMTTLTHHKKGVRCLALHPTQQGMVSGSSSSIRQWRLPQGNFLQNLEGQNTIINSMSINQDNVLFSGGKIHRDNGSMHFWDWKSGYAFQTTNAIAQPGSLENEAGIFCSEFDRTGSRLLTGEADKTIKIWKEDDSATPETHPITNWTPKLGKMYGL
ncbi:pre-mRNA-splicing factor prp46 [Kappamyces sp. JEL0829]|nr:pre-mRNA-splicing factor prp46 [Kappamyces sp. JEL0829]